MVEIGSIDTVKTSDSKTPCTAEDIYAFTSENKIVINNTLDICKLNLYDLANIALLHFLTT